MTAEERADLERIHAELRERLDRADRRALRDGDEWARIMRRAVAWREHDASCPGAYRRR